MGFKARSGTGAEKDVRFIRFEDRMWLTKEQVSSFFEITPRTIDNYLSKFERELRQNGYEVVKGNRLKELKKGISEQFGNEMDFVAKTTVLGIFDFRAFLNIANRTPYDYIEIDQDSSVERDIAEKLDSNENVKFFCKLPSWFVVPTPLGNYNPDWAVVTEKDEKVYLVRETKSTHDRDQRREFENRKIDCGRAHFDALGVNFKVATNIHEVLA